MLLFFWFIFLAFLKVKSWCKILCHVYSSYDNPDLYRRLQSLIRKAANTVKKGYWFSRLQPGCHLPNSPWPGIIKLFPARGSLVNDIPSRDGKTANIFFTVKDNHTKNLTQIMKTEAVRALIKNMSNLNHALVERLWAIPDSIPTYPALAPPWLGRSAPGNRSWSTSKMIQYVIHSFFWDLEDFRVTRLLHP